jgi:hypothetical protein
MGYKPNPFVNPNQRGVELPPGCKDLMDVLKMGWSERPGVASQMIWYGVLSDVEQSVRTFLEPGYGERLLSVGIPQRRILVILLKREDGLTLNFSASKKQRSVVRRMFMEAKIVGSIDGMEYVTVALGPAKDVVAMTIVELLVQVFGVLVGEQLMFCSYERVEGTGEGDQGGKTTMD